MNLVKTITIETNYKSYEVTVHSNGRIFIGDKEPSKLDNGAGYLAVTVGYKIKESGKLVPKLEYVHRLVAKAFIPNPDNLPQVNHKDFNKSNNDVSNLEWVSRADNIKHSHDNGRMQKRYDVGPVTILTVEQVKECYTRVVVGCEGVNVVAVSMNKPRTTISSIINKRSRRDITDKLDEEFASLTEAQKLVIQDQTLKNST